MPRLSRSCVVTVVTGFAVSFSLWRRMEPVTTTSTGWSDFAAESAGGGVVGVAWAAAMPGNARTRAEAVRDDTNAQCKVVVALSADRSLRFFTCLSGVVTYGYVGVSGRHLSKVCRRRVKSPRRKYVNYPSNFSPTLPQPVPIKSQIKLSMLQIVAILR